MSEWPQTANFIIQDKWCAMTNQLEHQEWAERIGKRLRNLRKTRGLTLGDLSRLSGATVPTLSHLERGTRDVKLSTLVGLANALRVDLPSLLTVEGQSAEPSSKPDVDGYDLEAE